MWLYRSNNSPPPPPQASTAQVTLGAVGLFSKVFQAELKLGTAGLSPGWCCCV